jgi:hypothetical protein
MNLNEKKGNITLETAATQGRNAIYGTINPY